MVLSKATCIGFKEYILSVLAFPGNQIYDLGAASAVL